MSRRVLRISDSLLLAMLRDGNECHYRVADGLPADVRIVDFKMEGRWQSGRGQAVFLLESGAWEATPDGKEYSPIDPTLTTIYPEDTGHGD